MNPATATPLVDGQYRALLEQVEQRAVWWHPDLNKPHQPANALVVARNNTATSGIGGWVRHVGGRTLLFSDLPQLIALWELVGRGYVKAAPAPDRPDAAHHPRPAVLTAAGMAALRGT